MHFLEGVQKERRTVTSAMRHVCCKRASTILQLEVKVILLAQAVSNYVGWVCNCL